MAKSLAATIKASVAWTFTNTVTGLSNSVTINDGFSYSKSLTNGTGAAGTADLIYFVQSAIAGAGTANYDLYGTLTDVFGATISMARVKMMYVEVTDDTTATHVNFGAHAAPLVNWISVGTTTIKIFNDSVFLLATGSATAYPVTDSTADGLKVANGDATNTATVNLCVIGGSA